MQYELEYFFTSSTHILSHRCPSALFPIPDGELIDDGQPHRPNMTHRY